VLLVRDKKEGAGVGRSVGGSGKSGGAASFLFSAGRRRAPGGSTPPAFFSPFAPFLPLSAVFHTMNVSLQRGYRQSHKLAKRVPT